MHRVRLGGPALRKVCEWRLASRSAVAVGIGSWGGRGRLAVGYWRAIGVLGLAAQVWALRKGCEWRLASRSAVAVGIGSWGGRGRLAVGYWRAIGVLGLAAQVWAST